MQRTIGTRATRSRCSATGSGSQPAADRSGRHLEPRPPGVARLRRRRRSRVAELIPALLGTAVFLYGGLVFLRGGHPELRDRQPGMMTLISMAIIVAFVTSWAATLGLFEVEIWWELATLITIMLLGHWLEMRSIAQARGRPRRPRRAPARHRRARIDGEHRDGPALGARRRRPRARATGRSRPCRWRVVEAARPTSTSR